MQRGSHRQLLAPAKVRLVHVARRQLQLTEEDYRAAFAIYGGSASCTDLSNGGFSALLKRFEELGFRSTSTRRPMPARAGMASPSQVSLIRQLWHDFTGGDGTDASLGTWLERQFRVSALRFMTSELAPK